MRFGIGATGLDRWKEYFKTVPRRTDAKFLLYSSSSIFRPYQILQFTAQNITSPSVIAENPMVSMPLQILP
jgi:hypothetical protein